MSSMLITEKAIFHSFHWSCGIPCFSRTMNTAVYLFIHSNTHPGEVRHTSRTSIAVIPRAPPTSQEELLTLENLFLIPYTPLSLHKDA
jgi:hypothetical protein